METNKKWKTKRKFTVPFVQKKLGEKDWKEIQEYWKETRKETRKDLKKPEKVRIEFYDTVASGLILRVTKKGSKSYAFRYWYDGSSKQLTIGGVDDYTLAGARKIAKEYIRQINQGLDPLRVKKENKEDSPKTFSEVVSEYREKHLPTLKESTRNDYEYRIKHLVKGEGTGKVTSRGFDGSRYIKDIQRHEIYDFLMDVAKTASTQAKRLQAILSGVFEFARDRNFIDTNPATKIRIQSNKKTSQKRENSAYDDVEIRALWEQFDNHTEPVGSFFKVLLLTGQRAGETRLMKWENIDFENALWQIPGTDTKNGTEHFVPLSETVLDILTRLSEWTRSRYVFESPVKKMKPIGHQQKGAQRISKKIGFSFNIHSLRHTFATRQAGIGTSPQVLSKLLNHKQPGEGSTITAIYNRYDYEKEKRNAMENWERELQRIVNGAGARIIQIA